MYKVTIEHSDLKEKTDEQFDAIFFIGITFDGKEANVRHISNVETESVLNFINDNVETL